MSEGPGAGSARQMNGGGIMEHVSNDVQADINEIKERAHS
jgi:hypothetical protein